MVLPTAAHVVFVGGFRAPCSGAASLRRYIVTANITAAAATAPKAPLVRSFCCSETDLQRHGLNRKDLLLASGLSRRGGMQQVQQQKQQLRWLCANAAASGRAAAAAELPLAKVLWQQRCFLRRSFSLQQRGKHSNAAQQEDPLPAAAAAEAVPAAAAAQPSQPSELSAGVHEAPELPPQYRAGFAAQPPPPPPPPTRRWRTWMKVLVFVVISVSPVVAAVLLFKSLLVQRQEQQTEAARAAAEEDAALKTAQQIVANSLSCICIAGGAKDNRIVSTSVDPHLPESRVLRLPTKNLVKGMENNSLTYLVAGERSSFSLPFNFIHFAVSASSDLFEQFKAGNPLSLLYVDTSTGDSVLLTGVAAVVDLDPYRTHYWRSSWSSSIPGGRTSADYKLVKFVPNSIAIDLGLRGPAKWRPIRLSRLITQENIQWKLDNAPPALIS
ncbi:hypothetical protein, conserved [Eimeria tenella]|uniref:Uncharacterized protein n=1 Tax=Eimeria tenella TaxID=5802 RepID=U6L002_EIMTE|nr:hypothetical protein, conserved [Eimeria tenella]CDJ41904.1 hypothetical protein, conserved [Eimeria tenella]|eukprot:XP_013232654.1 hypothetical protein, conserved [Eimeria tenella]